MMTSASSCLERASNLGFHTAILTSSVPSLGSMHRLWSPQSADRVHRLTWLDSGSKIDNVGAHLCRSGVREKGSATVTKHAISAPGRGAVQQLSSCSGIVYMRITETGLPAFAALKAANVVNSRSVVIDVYSRERPLMIVLIVAEVLPYIAIPERRNFADVALGTSASCLMSCLAPSFCRTGIK